MEYTQEIIISHIHIHIYHVLTYVAMFVDGDEKLDRFIGDSDRILFLIVATHPPAFLPSVIVFRISAIESSMVLSTPTQRLC